MKLNRVHTMGIAALIMGGSVFLSRIMGLVRDKVISWQYGASPEADVYFTAFVIPDFINYLLAGGYVSITLIPLLAKRFEEDVSDGWRFFSTVLLWAGLAIGALTLIAFVAAPELSVAIAPGFDALQTERLTLFLRIILPSQIFFLLGACLSALLYIRKQFTVPALMPLIYNGCIIAGGVLFGFVSPEYGMEGFCWGVLLGAFLGAFVLPLLAVCKGDFQVRLSLKHPLMGRFLILALPLMLGQSVVVLDEQFVRIFGSLAGDGAVSLLNFARRIMLVPVGVVAQAAGIASYPFLAALMANNDEARFNATLQSALHNTLLVVLPLTGLMFALSAPILGFIFEGGQFGAAHTIAATPLLQAMLLAVPFWAVQQLMGRAFYARQNTLTPAIMGSLATFAAIPMYVWAVEKWQALGVAVVTTVSLFVYTLILCLCWYKKHGNAPFVGLVKPVLSGMAIAGISAYATGQILALLPPVPTFFAMPVMQSIINYGVQIGVGACLFACSYLLIARLIAPWLVRR